MMGFFLTQVGASICLQQIANKGTGVKVGFLSSSTHPYTASECYLSDSIPTSLVDTYGFLQYEKIQHWEEFRTEPSKAVLCFCT